MLHQTLAAAQARLEAAGIAADEAAIDVDLYTRTILGWDRARLITERRASTPDALEPRFSQWVARREQREPSAYIVGSREFWGRDFIVSSAVLIPRPESELIVDEALRHIPADRPMRVADVGTGSGCLAVSIACERPLATVTATDISEVALEVGRENARRHDVVDRTAFTHASYLDGIPGPFDVIVANPPYVRETDRPAIVRQVVEYEPHVALFGGADGLRDITAVIEAADAKLVSGGYLIFEFGLGQDDRISELVGRYSGFALERFRDDLQAIPRTAVLKRL